MWVGDWAVSNLTRVVTLDLVVLFEQQQQNFVFFFLIFFWGRHTLWLVGS